jgi:hypothetical protein
VEENELKGWFGEPVRHGLAARGIQTRARALVRTSGELNPSKIEHVSRIERRIEDLGRVLRTGRISSDYGAHGGLTAAWPIDGDSRVSGLGWVRMILDPVIMLKENNLVKVEYTEDFFEEHPEIGERVRGNVMSDWSPEDLVQYEDEQELISDTTIVIPPEAVQRIEIHYGDDIPDPITGNEEYTSWELGSEEHLHLIFEVIERSIPHQFWNRTYVVGDEGEYRIGDYVK